MTVDRRFFETLLAQKKLSMRGLAAKMGKTHSQLSLIFSGQRRMQLDEATQLADIFGVPLHRIAEAAGGGRTTGRRVPVIGKLTGKGQVELHPKSVIERTMAPEGVVPDKAVAIQAHTHDTQHSWMDGWVFFCAKTDQVEPDAIGRFCIAKVKGGDVVMATVRRGYRDNTFNLTGPFAKESVILEWAAPVVLTRT